MSRASRIVVILLPLVAMGVFGWSGVPTHAAGRAADSLKLSASEHSPQPVGSAITWRVSGGPKGSVYRFSVARKSSGPFQIVRDFSPRPSFLMAPLDVGAYFVRAAVAPGYGGAARIVLGGQFTFDSRVTGLLPVITTTDNPSVALVSTPACTKGTEKIGFAPASANVPSWQFTGSQTCDGQSLNFLIAGMLPSVGYQIEIFDNKLCSTGCYQTIYFSPPFAQSFETGSQSASTETTVHMMLSSSATMRDPVATVKSGAEVWYLEEPDLYFVWPVRMAPDPGSGIGSEIYLFGDDGQTPLAKGVTVADNVIRVVDLAGNPLAETNVEDVNVQLKAMGHQSIYGFGHEALPLPGGRLALMAVDERKINGEPTAGDMVVVLNSNMQVVWVWDAFDHLNTKRAPTDQDTCVGFPSVVCPVPGYPKVIDWTHANALDYSSVDGDLIVSVRNQDWIVKIAYDYGKGNGHVIWTLGKGGDFKLVPLGKNDTWPWFSHQHNANFVDGSDNTIELLDDGDTRLDTLGLTDPSVCEGTAICDSRGQVYRLNVKTHTATQILNANLGVYSHAQGSAQRLPNGNYFFTAGSIQYTPFLARDIEVNPKGQTVFSQVLYGNTEYRAWMLPTLYSPLVSLMK